MTLKVQLPEYAEPLLKPARWKSLRGGRGSTKSHSFAQLAILRMAGYLPDYPDDPIRIASFRQFKVSIPESVYTVVKDYITRYGLQDEFRIKRDYIDHVNGSHMWFPAFERNTESFMSAEGVDVLWVEQAETLLDQMRTIAPTMRKPGSELWFSWNPAGREQWCWQRFKLRPREGDVSLEINWQHNPWWFPRCTECRRQYRRLRAAGLGVRRMRRGDRQRPMGDRSGADRVPA